MEIVREGTALFSGTVVRSGKYPEVDLPGLGSDPVRLIELLTKSRPVSFMTRRSG